MDKPFPAYQGDEEYVFVSYSHDDEHIVYEEIRWLQDLGVNVWYDQGIGAGSEWSDELAKAIKGCSRFLYFITPNSVTSENCRRELNFAITENRPLLAIHLTDTTVPDGLRLNLDNRQSILKHKRSQLDYQQTVLNALETKTERVPASQSARTIPKRRVVYSVFAVVVSTIGGLYFLIPPLISDVPFETIDEQRVQVDAGLAGGAHGWNTGGSALPPENVPSTQESQSSIALLPLRDLAGSSDLFGEAVSREIWSKLVRVTGLRVISMTSSLQFVDSALAIQEVGRQLTADYIVEGSVMRSENLARVNVFLTRVGDGTTLWNASYTRTLDDATAMFLLLDEISAELGQALPSHIEGTANLETPTKPATNNLGSYNLLLQAKHEFGRTGDALRAVELAKQAIALDPEYAHAHAEMGFYYLMMSEWGFGQPKPMLIEARDALTRSLELDPNWGNAHVYLGMVYDRLDLDFGKALAAYERGRVLGADQDAYATVAGATLLPAGRFEEALTIAEAAAGRNPGDGWYRLSIGRLLQRLGRNDEALHEYELAVSLSPDERHVRSEVVYALLQLGMIGRARTVLEESPIDGSVLENWFAYHDGNTKPMRDWVDKAIANREQDYVPAFAISLALYALGDYAAHVHWFRKRVEERDAVAWILDDIRRETDYWERMEEWSRSDEARREERVELLRQHRQFFEKTTEKMVL